jgi:hypothetical protein
VARKAEKLGGRGGAPKAMMAQKACREMGRFAAHWGGGCAGEGRRERWGD